VYYANIYYHDLYTSTSKKHELMDIIRRQSFTDLLDALETFSKVFAPSFYRIELVFIPPNEPQT
jgi:hypothetical protein